MGNFVKNRRIISGSTSVVVPVGTTADRPEYPTFGSFRYNTTLGALEYFNGTQFKRVGVVGEVDIVVDSFTGDGSTLTYTMSVQATDEEQIIVFVGSIYQNPTTYTVSSYDLTFTGAPPPGEVINVIHNLGSTAAP